VATTRATYTSPYTTLFRSKRPDGCPTGPDVRGLGTDRCACTGDAPAGVQRRHRARVELRSRAWPAARIALRHSVPAHRAGCRARSEEHTSELPSRENIVCR